MRALSDLIDTTEMYLKTVFELEEEGIPALRARIVERLGQSGPTVSETVARLERDRLLAVGEDRQIRFSELGLERAADVMRRHRLAECLLKDVIGIDWPQLHDEACRWEHVISDEVAEKISGILGNPTQDPFGNPIPRAGARGVVLADPATAGLVSLAELDLDGGAKTSTVKRLSEVIQVDSDVLAELLTAGIVPGAEVTVISSGPNGVVVAVASEGEKPQVTVAVGTAKHIYVAA